jgi:hypothetical protein
MNHMAPSDPGVMLSVPGDCLPRDLCHLVVEEGDVTANFTP